MDYSLANPCLINKPVRTASTPTYPFAPVSPEEVRRALNLGDVSYHDPELLDLMYQAMETVEHDTGIVCATGTYTIKFSDWPDGEYQEIPAIRPVTSITSIVYIAADGTPTTWPNTNYSLDTAPVVPIVKLGYANIWPNLRGDWNGITATIVAGYASAAEVPARVKEAIKCAIAVDWRVKIGEDAKDYMALYERVIGKLARATYP